VVPHVFCIADVDTVKHRRLSRFSVTGSNKRLAFTSPGRWNLSPRARYVTKIIVRVKGVVVISHVFIFDVRIEVDNDTPIELA
jgi:hypothetical protein